MPKILLVPVGKPPRETRIDPGLDAMQAIVGGYIEQLTLEPNVGLICNEEGKLNGLPPNRSVGNDTICGDFFISRIDEEGSTIDVTPADVKKYTKRFARE